ncbi:DNA-3-methyladenine glycosylase 2 family protein [Candidatus Bathyarchaeota archaeon]|nr:DNA-3-methyladenine glycosylase 2 family protein [Candidatus Bathyarchaeota archaeon]
MEIKLNGKLSPFSLESTLNCGQLFRWKKLDEWWYGVVQDRIIKIKQQHEKLFFQFFPNYDNRGFIEKYLRLDDNLSSIFSKINKDDNIRKAIEIFSGLRLCRQDPWECLISYICATYKSIPAIKKMINNISKCYGKKLTFDGYDFYTFPKPNELAQIDPKYLLDCGLGFRTKRVVKTAQLIHDGELVLNDLKQIEYSEAKRKLLVLPGVGHKVADCVLLFSLEKLEAFPVDVWIKRVVTTLYPHYFDSSFIKRIANKSSITQKEYEIISSFGREYFGSYAGYAQEYLFHYIRTTIPQ